MTSVLRSIDFYSDSRSHGYQGPDRYVSIQRVTSTGGGCIAKSEDGTRCVVAGKESLRILRISDGTPSPNLEYRSAVGRGGFRIEATRNLWEGSGLKIDSAMTGVAWGHGPFNHKIFTSARNGELIMWDISRTGPAKLERRTKDHIRSINQLSISHSVYHYCVTGSADGDLRIWDLRDMSKSLMRVHHPTSVRSVAFSPSLWQPLQAIVGLDNGSIYRWDLKMGQRGLLDRLLVAHTTPVTTLDWRNPPGITGSETTDNGLGWFVSGGLDRCVKVWDLMTPGPVSHIPSKPTYTLHPSHPVRHVLWRPGPNSECEIAIISSPELTTAASKTSVSKLSQAPLSATAPLLSRPAGAPSGIGGDAAAGDADSQHSSTPPLDGKVSGGSSMAATRSDSSIEIWDVRRGWIAKWSVRSSGAEGSLTDVVFADSDAMWAQHSSGAFSQFDLRDAIKPIYSIPRVALTWDARGSIVFVSDRKFKHEVPYDDIHPDMRVKAEKQNMYIKALGDEPTQPLLQVIGTQHLQHAASCPEAFKQLAMKYVVTGENRKLICLQNAQLAGNAGRHDAAQLWLLLASCLDDVILAVPPILPPTNINIQEYNQPPTPSSAHYSQSYFQLGARPIDGNQIQPQKTSPSRGSIKGTENANKFVPKRSSPSNRLTPASSASSSPRHGPIHLPPITPRRPSFFGRRESIESGIRPAAYRRPSVHAASFAHTSSPADKSASSSRHVGEGALDDSDSSSSGNDSDIGSIGTAGNWSDDETHMRTMLSPTIASQRTIVAPSPLSRIAGQQHWADVHDADVNADGDDEDDDATSPSPQSSDTDSSGHRHVPSLRRQSSARRNGRYKTRSRSSTMASLAASVVPERPRARRDSQSSVRTIVAGDMMHGELDNLSVVKADDTVRDLSTRMHEVKVPEVVRDADQELFIEGDHFTERRIEIVQMEEKRLRDIGWQALREAVNMLAEQGDMQMCAMFVIIARPELRIGVQRGEAFVNAYIEMLNRLRMFSVSANIRKYCQLECIQKATMLVTRPTPPSTPHARDAENRYSNPQDGILTAQL
ncbi:hypothetical protein AX17_002213 [Amanita inopinata Kibby_2008]|nr:hypothetical protein AX17_002213 [Amanita inopinata Kibby_2008]